MNDLELLESVIAVLPPYLAQQFKHYLAQTTKMQAKRVQMLGPKALAHYCRDRRARFARTWARNHSTEYAKETPQQAYDRVYNAQARLQLAYLQQLLSILGNRDTNTDER